MLQIDNLSKHYTKERALNNLNLNIATGDIYALVGPNGSGKTTLINILLGLIFPTNGTITYTNTGVKIGASIGTAGFFPSFSVLKNIKIINSLISAPASEIDQYLSYFELEEAKRKKFKRLSQGMQQKVSLISAFLGKPDFIILDEPTNNLDFDMQVKLLALVKEKNAEGVTFLVTSHILSDIEKVCNKVTFIKSGEVLHTSDIEYYKRNYENIEKAYQEITK